MSAEAQTDLFMIRTPLSCSQTSLSAQTLYGVSEPAETTPKPCVFTPEPGPPLELPAIPRTKPENLYVKSHFDNVKVGNYDKTEIPLCLLLSGTGTGKSRNAAEFHKTVLNWFNGEYNVEGETYFEPYPEIVTRLTDPFVFHVSFENGSSPEPGEESNPFQAIGSRMLLQLLPSHL
jgi:hypothetical protein